MSTPSRRGRTVVVLAALLHVLAGVWAPAAHAAPGSAHAVAVRAAGPDSAPDAPAHPADCAVCGLASSAGRAVGGGPLRLWVPPTARVLEFREPVRARATLHARDSRARDPPARP